MFKGFLSRLLNNNIKNKSKDMYLKNYTRYAVTSVPNIVRYEFVWNFLRFITLKNVLQISFLNVCHEKSFENIYS
jgi:hypothetical protein